MVLRIIKRQFFLYLNEHISCDPSLEPSCQDGSHGGSQNMFLWRNMANIPKLSLLPLLIWSTGHFLVSVENFFNKIEVLSIIRVLSQDGS